MAMSITLSEYLADLEVDFNLLKHKYTTNAFDTAYTAQIPMDKLAKAIVLEDDRGHRLMAVLPSMCQLQLERINRRFNRQYHCLEEGELKQIFGDCDPGAIPAVGQAFRLQTICDEQLLDQPYVYIETGDHRELVKLDHHQFQRLMALQDQDRISDQYMDSRTQ